MPMPAPITRTQRILTVMAVLGVVVGLVMALVYAGTDQLQGEVQRIFYLHFASFYAALVAFACAVVGGVLYLRTRIVKWDILALAGVEVGFGLSAVMVTTGMIWARPVWNTWWTWEPRLTSVAIMMLTYAAYLMLRNAIENPDQRRRFASVYGILAMGTVLFSIVIIRIRPDTLYSAVIGGGTGKATFYLSERMTLALMVNVAVWCGLLTPALIWWRIRLENLRDYVQYVKTSYLNR